MGPEEGGCGYFLKGPRNEDNEFVPYDESFVLQKQLSRMFERSTDGKRTPMDHIREKMYVTRINERKHPDVPDEIVWQEQCDTFDEWNLESAAAGREEQVAYEAKQSEDQEVVAQLLASQGRHREAARYVSPKTTGGSLYFRVSRNEADVLLQPQQHINEIAKQWNPDNTKEFRSAVLRKNVHHKGSSKTPFYMPQYGLYLQHARSPNVADFVHGDFSDDSDDDDFEDNKEDDEAGDTTDLKHEPPLFDMEEEDCINKHLRRLTKRERKEGNLAFKHNKKKLPDEVSDMRSLFPKRRTTKRTPSIFSVCDEAAQCTCKLNHTCPLCMLRMETKFMKEFQFQWMMLKEGFALGATRRELRMFHKLMKRKGLAAAHLLQPCEWKRYKAEERKAHFLGPCNVVM